MKLLKWLSVTDRFYKIYLDKQLAHRGQVACPNRFCKIGLLRKAILIVA